MPPQLASVSGYEGSGIHLQATAGQLRLIAAIRSHTLTFALGPAGTGKSLVAAAEAVYHLDRGYEQVLLLRPAVACEEDLGALPGTADEKLAPYMAPLLGHFERLLGSERVRKLERVGVVRCQSLSFLRGATFESSFVILDEAQNVSPTQMKLFLTRIGRRARVVVTGDLDQTDLRGPNGLEDAMARLDSIPQIAFSHLDPEDNMRSSLVRTILERYR